MTYKLASGGGVVELEHASAEDLAPFHNPKGVGTYIRSISESIHGKPKKAAKFARDNGLSFVVLLAVWQDIHKGKFRHLTPNSPDDILRYAEAFAGEGVMPWVWGFPWAGAEDQFVEAMFTAAPAPVIGVWYDPELGYKYKKKLNSRDASINMRGQPEALKDVSPTGARRTRTKQAKRLMNLTIDSMTERHGLAVTSYGITVFHENFPWEVFGGYGVGSPQLYSTPAGAIGNGIDQWRRFGWEHIIPSVGTFGKKAASPAILHNHLSGFVDDDERVPGFCFWSWKQTSRDEWKVIARWAEWFKRGIPNSAPGDTVIPIR